MNKKFFFDFVRKELFLNSISQSQVDGLDFILDYWLGQKEITDIKQFAYILGTIHHETGATMQPIEEWGRGKGKKYGKNLKIDGKPYLDKFHIYYGRGFTQNTWYENYEKLTKENIKGWDFLDFPELLLKPEPSIWATFYAMRTGLYTGRKLSDYFNEHTADWFNARKIVNGIDRAKLIADYSQTYLKALTA